MIKNEDEKVIANPIAYYLLDVALLLFNSARQSRGNNRYPNNVCTVREFLRCGLSVSSKIDALSLT